MHAELPVGVLEVLAHGARRQPEDLCDLGVQLAALDPLEDLELASRERQVALRCGAPPGPVDDALEVGSEELEHKPIALPEVALLRVEQERSGVTGARRRDPYLELVLVRAEDHVVELARAPLAGRQKVRHTPRPKVTGAKYSHTACWCLSSQYAS